MSFDTAQSMTRVKICGINDSAGFDAAVEAGADWLGFVFFPPSPRSVTPEAAASLSARNPDGPPRVGLFVEPTVEAIGTVLAGVRLDALQIYGAVNALPAIKTTFGLPIWRAIGISGPFDLPSAFHPADRLVLEAKAPAGASRPGGNAMTFDWSVLSGWSAPGPWMLAGGLTPETVAAAIRQTGAQAVDVSSGVERSKGLKDPALIRAFIAAAKGARD
ncbi:MAG: phosphoribosylanthranilate isomerase [Rhodopila sp.]